jgi:predicted amidohydrolase YtcJ
MTRSNELLLHGGPIYTFDEERTIADAILFRDGVVTELGSYDSIVANTNNPREIDLEGRPVFPGFNDAHAHLLSVGIDQLETDLGVANTRDQALSMLAKVRF